MCCTPHSSPVPFTQWHCLSLSLSSSVRTSQNATCLHEISSEHVVLTRGCNTWFPVADTCRHTPLRDTCRNQGYQDPNDCTRCRCQDGFAGRFCRQLAPPKPITSESHPGVGRGGARSGKRKGGGGMGLGRERERGGVRSSPNPAPVSHAHEVRWGGERAGVGWGWME